MSGVSPSDNQGNSAGAQTVVTKGRVDRRHSASQIEPQVSVTQNGGTQNPKKAISLKADTVAMAPDDDMTTETDTSASRPIPKTRSIKKGSEPPAVVVPRPSSPPSSDQTPKVKGVAKPERPPPPKRSVFPPKTLSPPNNASSNKSPSRFYKATQDYQAQREGEINFSKGDVMVLIDGSNPDALYGMLDNGTTGLLPATCLEPFSPQ